MFRPLLVAAALFATGPAKAELGPAAPFAGIWRSASAGDLGTEIRTEGRQLALVTRYRGPDGLCMQVSAGEVGLDGAARIEPRETRCATGTVTGGHSCTLRMETKDLIRVSCAANGHGTVLRRSR